MNPLLYFHTLRHLRPVQIYGRVLRRFRIPPGTDALPRARRPSAGPWRPPAARTASMEGPDRFRFIGQLRGIAGGEAGWNDPSAARLWLYNLHYFDDLNAEGASARRPWHEALIRRWVRENPPGAGTGWEPYPLSLRIVNWVKWSLSGGPLGDDALGSLALQARWLASGLETHILGNHLFANAKGLVFAGAFFEGEEADRWLACGLRLLAREIREQILPDGGHFERSPMYHSLILEDVLDLLNLDGAFGGLLSSAAIGDGTLAGAASGMRRWLLAMCHPDGEIALLNDAAFDIAPPPRELERYSDRLGLPPVPPPGDGVTRLDPSGYVRIQDGPDVAILDTAEIGPDYQPGHGHADTLTFELSIGGKRVIVDPGTSRYAEGADRSRERSTAAHNTVCVDGMDSSEVWGAFRVARRARPFDRSIDEGGGVVVVRCSHDGYRRLRGSVVHRREWTFSRGRLRVEDRLEGKWRHAVGGFLLHPAVVSAGGFPGAGDVRGGSWRVEGGGSVRWRLENARGGYGPGRYSPGFGRTEETHRLVAVPEGAGMALELSWGDA